MTEITPEMIVRTLIDNNRGKHKLIAEKGLSAQATFGDKDTEGHFRDLDSNYQKQLIDGLSARATEFPKLQELADLLRTSQSRG